MISKILGGISSSVRSKLVAHRGYHDVNDSLSRPLENTVEAYKQAFKELSLAECDVTCSKDGVIYLCHDSNFKRLTSSSNADETKSNVDVVGLSSVEIDSIELTDSQRPARLRHVLEVCARMSTPRHIRKLVIEIKPSAPERMLVILIKELEKNPSLLKNVGVVMSFNHHIVKRFREIYEESAKKHKPFVSSRPKFLILCRSTQVFSKTKTNQRKRCLKTDMCDSTIDFRNTKDIARILKEQDGKVDGFYLQLSDDMINDDEGFKSLKYLCSKYTIGVWGSAKLGDPDSLDCAFRLLSAGVSFVNTDIPEKFAISSL
jgi:glycerophosphoryl diester phosphodiesterase